MQASYSVVLLVHLNCSLIETGYCFLLGEIITTPAQLPYTFIASSKYIVNHSGSSSFSTTSTSLFGKSKFKGL
jgi:hypothetical protein